MRPQYDPAKSYGIPGYPGYQIDRKKNVWSFRTRGYRNIFQKNPTLIRGSTKGSHDLGIIHYRRFRLYHQDGHARTMPLHQIIMLVWKGPPPKYVNPKGKLVDMEVRHLDDDPTNNRVSNLAYGTHEENGGDRIRHGKPTKRYGKLTPEKVRQIRTRRSAGESPFDLAREYKMTYQSILLAVTRRSWKHVE